MNKEKCILLVDDDPNVVKSLCRVLSDEPYRVITACSAGEALDTLKQSSVQLIISDEQMPGMSGSELLSCVRESYPRIIRIILTGKASIESAMKAVNQGEIYRFFTKPWDPVELTLSVRNGLERYDLEQENALLLKTVKRQKEELADLERTFPGISTVSRDNAGTIVSEELSHDDIEEIKAWCERQGTDG